MEEGDGERVEGGSGEKRVGFKLPAHQILRPPLVRPPPPTIPPSPSLSLCPSPTPTPEQDLIGRRKWARP